MLQAVFREGLDEVGELQPVNCWGRRTPDLPESRDDPDRAATIEAFDRSFEDGPRPAAVLPPHQDRVEAFLDHAERVAAAEKSGPGRGARGFDETGQLRRRVDQKNPLRLDEVQPSDEIGPVFQGQVQGPKAPVPWLRRSKLARPSL